MLTTTCERPVRDAIILDHRPESASQGWYIEGGPDDSMISPILHRRHGAQYLYCPPSLERAKYLSRYLTGRQYHIDSSAHHAYGLVYGTTFALADSRWVQL